MGRDGFAASPRVEDRCALLRALFEHALRAVEPAQCLSAHWPARPPGRLAVLALGKAAAPMAAAALAHYGEPLDGLVILPGGLAVDPDVAARFEIVEAAHPTPDERSVAAAQAALALAAGLGRGDTLLALVSGGGSSLMCLPCAGVSLDDKRRLTRQLLRSGAGIDEINCIRKHLSGIKGGRLRLAAQPARVVTLAISDVPGDDPGLIASGPTLADTTTLADARAIIERYGIDAPATVRRALSDPANETPSLAPDAPVAIVASAATALEAAAGAARRSGFAPIVLGDALEGEASTLGREHARLAREHLAGGGQRVLLSGGETTVTIAGTGGRGGRNTEYLLGLAIALDGERGIWALACDTDGIDGCGGHAGAVMRPDTLATAMAASCDPRAELERHNSAAVFAAAGDLIVTGPTQTNVNDFRAILVEQ